MQVNLSVPIQDMKFKKEAQFFEAHVILVMPVLGLHIPLDVNKLEDEATRRQERKTTMMLSLA